ncbi:copper chaperone PCu(A)C [Actinophytocola sp. NPDC049390]|uniref:copper chaperone PCu(A)C n=1 Tax=Actinophytocola sp. NPDC049390 TaxID=3363894 RepID=UPI00379883EB
MTVRRRASAAALVVLIGATGCGADPDRTADTMGSNGSVGAMLLRNVYVVAPGGDGYERGDDATVRLTLVNHAPRDDAVLGVRSTHAARVAMRWDRECDGVLEEVTKIPVLMNGTVPGADAAYELELLDLTRKVRAGTTVPITFTFRNAGEVRLDAMVEATHDGDAPAAQDCQEGTEDAGPT